MATDNLFYGSPEDSGGRLAVVSIFADRPHVRAVMRDDAEALGFQVSRVESLERLRHDRELSLGQIVLCDCSENDPAQLADQAGSVVQHVKRQGDFLLFFTQRQTDALASKR